MKIACCLLGLFLLGSEAIGGQAPAALAQGGGRAGGAPAQGQTFSGSFEGLITTHIASVAGDAVTVGTTQPGMPPIMSFRVDSNTMFFVMPNEGVPAKLVYKEVASGELKRFAWFADSPSLPGKTVKVVLEKGLATEVFLYAACTRQRCESSACKTKCKATKCACPPE
jgi:hypothetical protein